MIIVGIARFEATRCRCNSSPVIFGIRMSAIRQQTWLSRLDFSRLAAHANTAAAKPADSSRSLVVFRIDSSSSTIATSGLLGTAISRWPIQRAILILVQRGPARQLPERGENPHLQTFQAM